MMIDTCTPTLLTPSPRVVVSRYIPGKLINFTLLYVLLVYTWYLTFGLHYSSQRAFRKRKVGVYAITITILLIVDAPFR